MKKLLSILLVLLVAMSLAACNNGGGNEGGGETVEEKAKVGVSTISLDNDYCIQMNDGIIAAAKDKGYETMTLEGYFDAEKELANLDQMAAGGVKAMYFLGGATVGVAAERDAQYEGLGIFSQGYADGVDAWLVEDNEGIINAFLDAVDRFAAETGLNDAVVVGIFPAGSDNEDSQGYETLQYFINTCKSHFEGTGLEFGNYYVCNDTEEVSNTVDTILNTYESPKIYFCYNNDFAIVTSNTLVSAVKDTSDYLVYSSEGDDTSLGMIADAASPYRGCALGSTYGTGYAIGLQLVNWIENGKMENVPAVKEYVDWTNVGDYQ
ncbi:MAG: hypothetical protein IJL85_00860 [Erysipelotrichaceae bacterium]|nr:hypothetical protein [Erysipelotrichaceae bacterium]